MRTIDYVSRWKSLLTPDIVGLLSTIHEYKGEQTLFVEAKADTLSQLMEIAKIQSTEASNKIEGIYTSDERLKLIVKDKTMPKTRSEKEIAGYRDVLNTVHTSYEYIPLKSSIILQLHRDLYKYHGLESGGRYKSSDNAIAEVDTQGNKRVRFQPVSAWETPGAINELCNAFDEVIADGTVDPLLIITMVILDFLCIHPFHDGNGRMSRLLTLLLLYRAGYIVGKYISIEKAIERSKETYYEALQASSYGWHEGENDYEPFVRYMFGIIVSTYREFSSRVKLITTSGLSKPNRIREIIKETLGTVTKTELMEKCPDISQTTIQRTLNELLHAGEILKISGGRYTKYVWNREK